jgi:hypothetical protein
VDAEGAEAPVARLADPPVDPLAEAAVEGLAEALVEPLDELQPVAIAASKAIAMPGRTHPFRKGRSGPRPIVPSPFASVAIVFLRL